MTNIYDDRAKNDLLRIGINISVLRKERRLSQEALAERAGLSTVEIGLIESTNTENNSSMEVIYNVAQALDVAPEELFKGTSAM
ncbi:MAG: helix-turn-helix transcriptional regulator [Clostridia bacterium]|nr:helix-turn-helix transcriptional regulator [Clostridia bacterium]